MEYKYSRNQVFLINYHLTWCPKRRKKVLVNKLVKAFKGRSSNILRKESHELLKLPSLWTNSYFVSTAGNISNKIIQKYIKNQSKK